MTVPTIEEGRTTGALKVIGLRVVEVKVTVIPAACVNVPETVTGVAAIVPVPPTVPLDSVSERLNGIVLIVAEAETVPVQLPAGEMTTGCVLDPPPHANVPSRNPIAHRVMLICPSVRQVFGK